MKINTKQWFLDRIGKTVYRNRTSCMCAVCTKVYNDGLIIEDEFHAEYVSDYVASYNAEGSPLKYFDTLSDRNLFEHGMI